MAMENIRIAQHRDTLRYAHIRSGKYEPKSHKFTVGDYVYVQEHALANALQPTARAVIYRVKESFKDPATKRFRPYWGRVFFLGEEHRPKYFHRV